MKKRREIERERRKKRREEKRARERKRDDFVIEVLSKTARETRVPL